MSTMMKSGLKEAADGVLRRAVDQGVPGVVAMATNNDGNTYEGAAGKADLGTGRSMMRSLSRCNVPSSVNAL